MVMYARRLEHFHVECDVVPSASAIIPMLQRAPRIGEPVLSARARPPCPRVIEPPNDAPDDRSLLPEEEIHTHPNMRYTSRRASGQLSLEPEPRPTGESRETAASQSSTGSPREWLQWPRDKRGALNSSRRAAVVVRETD